MSRTPWGDSESLKGRRLRPGPGVPKEEVERNQRERLYGATVAVVARKGYAATSITDLIELAGVSRTTFYRYFPDKETCFVATLDEAASAALMLTKRRLGPVDGDPAELTERLLGIFLELIADQADAARLCMVESFAVGPRAIARMDVAMEGFLALADRLFDALPDHRGLPPEVRRALVGGVRFLVQKRLEAHREEELADLVTTLVKVALSYGSPPDGLRGRRTRSAAASVPAVLRPPDAPERIEAATLGTIARHGYLGANIAEIATNAGVSLSTFYETYGGKPEALAAALYRRRLQLYAVILPAFRLAGGWAAGLRASILSCAAFLEGDATLCRVITVDVHVAGREPREEVETALGSLREMIERAPNYGELGIPAASEVIAAAAYALLPRPSKVDAPLRARSLAPVATFLLTAPFLGAEAAWELATGREAPVARAGASAGRRT